ncbi:MAG: hypothetical protein N2234_10735, partial [Planctomycetota bacterium]|nr:hypothetical protein [Planctomycetota bacterium]
QSDRSEKSVCFEINPILWRRLSILKYKSEQEKSEFRFIYRLIYYEGTKDSHRFELNPLFYYKDNPWGWESGVLGGLFGIGSTEEAGYVRLLWLLKL